MVTLTRVNRSGWITLLVVAMLSFGSSAGADIAADLEALRAENVWGEVSLESGQVRHIKIDSVTADQVTLTEVIGALHERSAVYSLTDVHSVRSLGPRRIQQRISPHRRAPSLPVALGLELLVPGAGYYHAGERAQGWWVLLASVAVGATALTAGQDAAAAWIPLGSWLKLYSLHHLADEVNAVRAVADRSTRRLSADPVRAPSLGLHLRF